MPSETEKARREALTAVFGDIFKILASPDKPEAGLPLPQLNVFRQMVDRLMVEPDRALIVVADKPITRGTDTHTIYPMTLDPDTRRVGRESVPMRLSENGITVVFTDKDRGGRLPNKASQAAPQIRIVSFDLGEGTEDLQRYYEGLKDLKDTVKLGRNAETAGMLEKMVSEESNTISQIDTSRGDIIFETAYYDPDGYNEQTGRRGNFVFSPKMTLTYAESVTGEVHIDIATKQKLGSLSIDGERARYLGNWIDSITRRTRS